MPGVQRRSKPADTMANLHTQKYKFVMRLKFISRSSRALYTHLHSLSVTGARRCRRSSPRRSRAWRALQKQTPHMGQLVPQRQLKSLGLEHVNSTLAAALQAPPTARRTFGRVIDGRHNRWSPSWALEAAAAQRLIELGFMGGLLDCCSIFFTIAHADDPDANKLLAVKLMFHRKDLRCDTRPQALGKSGLGVDLDIYLRQLILDKFGTTLDAIFEEFFAESGYNEKVWNAEQVRSEPTPRSPHPHTILTHGTHPRMAPSTHHPHTPEPLSHAARCLGRCCASSSASASSRESSRPRSLRGRSVSSGRCGHAHNWPRCRILTLAA